MMKTLRLAVLFLPVLLLSGCVADMIAAERPRGSGSRRVIDGTAEEVREAFHRYIEKENASRASNVPPTTVTDGTDMSEAVNSNSVMGTAIVIREKLYLSPGPEAGQTEAEVICEFPSIGGMDKPDYLARQEKTILDSMSDSVELAHARSGRAAPSREAASRPAAAQAAWWK